MIWTFFFTALAVCPEDIRAPLQSAESDIAMFYLADASDSLGVVMSGFGCTGPAKSEELARFWLATGAVYYLNGNERSNLAFAAARQVDPDTWVSDYGDDMHSLWEAATPPGGTGSLTLRGLGDGESVWLNGASATAPFQVSAGLHLLQVGAATARTARLVQVAPDEEVVVALERAASTTRVVEHFPFDDVVPPLRREGRRFQDGEGTPLSWQFQVQPLASSSAGGRAAIQLHRSNRLAQLGVGAAGLGAAYATYVFAWDAAIGRNLDSGISWTLTGAGFAAVTGAIATEIHLGKRRTQLRRDIATAANRVVLENRQ